MKTRLDTTLFAWGRRTPDLTHISENTTVKYPLLADAPSYFEDCSDVVYSPSVSRRDALSYSV